jgi:hypothetical protein
MTPQQAYATVQQTLLSIVMETMTFEEIDANLRQNGYHSEADTLDRLIQDVGLELKRAMDAPAPGDATAGPKTAAINTLYKPVTAQRLFDLFDKIVFQISRDDLCASLMNLTEELHTQEKDFTTAQAVIHADENPAPATVRADKPTPPFP